MKKDVYDSGEMKVGNKKTIDYEDGLLWYFDNYPQVSFYDQCGKYVVLPSQTLRLEEAHQ